MACSGPGTATPVRNPGAAAAAAAAAAVTAAAAAAIAAAAAASLPKRQPAAKKSAAKKPAAKKQAAAVSMGVLEEEDQDDLFLSPWRDDQHDFKQPLGAGSQGEAAGVQAQQHAELNGKLRLLGLALDEATKVDGDCLPDAVARMLRSHPELYLSAGGPQEMTHETVRAGIVKWVDENLNTQYTPQVFNDADVGEGSWTVEELIQAILIPEMRAGVPPRPHVQTVTDYLAEIARHGTYADQLSLVAAASTYGLALTVVSSRPGTEHMKVNPTNQPASRSIFFSTPCGESLHGGETGGQLGPSGLQEDRTPRCCSTGRWRQGC